MVRDCKDPIFQLFEIFLSLLTLLCTPVLVFSQAVINDSIDHRIPLSINAGFYSSSTDHCTVEWNCVEKEKLRSSITFHNDQWFSFIPKKGGDHYLVVKNQRCKDNRGVQLLVIDGKPCEPSTYKYLKLHSLLSTEDINYKLTDLNEKTQYLISVDGLLGDLCQFQIGISDTVPTNVIYSAVREVQSSATRDNQIVTLTWKAGQALADTVSSFTIYRKIGSNRLYPLDSFPTNSYSYRNKEYEFLRKDTLRLPENYVYYIIGQTSYGNRYLYKTFSFANNLIYSDNKFIYTFRSDFKGKGEIRFSLLNAENDQLLFVRSKENSRKEMYGINLSQYFAQGITRFRILIEYKNNPETKIEELFIIK